MADIPVLKNHALQAHNSFGFRVTAEFFFSAGSGAEIRQAIDFSRDRRLQLRVLGEGSNLVLAKDLEGLVLRPAIMGIDILEEDDRNALVSIGAGQNWHEFILWCLANNLFGLENLSLIPGSVGAAPIQNIGAYGAEQDEVFCRLEAISRESGDVRVFTREDCRFGYRDSIFKRELQDQYIITRVFYRLNKQANLNTSYGALAAELERIGEEPYTGQLVSRAVCNIRRSKLPDPMELGNAGSFFKNPVVERAEFEVLKQAFRDIVGYPESGGRVKLAAGWLIEHCGWKGYRRGQVGVHDRQALVLVNYGQGSGDELMSLARDIQQSVRETFGVTLETEPRIYR